MAAAFYSRYVPPSAASPETRGGGEKRKREADIDHATAAPKSTRRDVERKRSKKRKNKNKNKNGNGNGNKNGNAVETDGSPAADESLKATTSPQDDAAQTDWQTVEDKTSSRDASTDSTADRTVKAGRSDGSAPHIMKSHEKRSADAPASGGPTNKESGSSRRRSGKQKLDDNEVEAESGTSIKHAKIMSKFERAQSKTEQLPEAGPGEIDREMGEDADNPDILPHGLEPLPQPAPAPQQTELPTYATLPSWLAEPYSVPFDLRRDFKSIGVDSKLVSTLQSKGFTEAFPIQSAVSTLLSRGPDYHDGDICISAATGSGKTLAYALPLVAGIEYSPVSRLRGLIVVPTRELVKQARESCEFCASGSGLRIGTAVGSTALKEEQQQLMRWGQIYDPVSYRNRKEKPMTANDWASFNLADYLTDTDEFQHTLPDHVSTSSPNVDILVCTPGRLVDHIRSTKGFTLEHVQWLIIDEADRLLNESFQEWVETVMPAFESSKVVEKGTAQSFLSQLGKSMNRPKLRKIILSATMTRDITKLNSLRLQDPKLVVMDDHNDAGKSNMERENDTVPSEPQDNMTQLPATLHEFYVPVGDGSEKPLYLLQLLRRHLNVWDKGLATRPRRSSSVSFTVSSSSSEGTSDDDDDDDDSSASSTSSASSNTSSSSSSSSSSSTPVATDQQSVLIFTKSSESAARLSRLLCLLHPPLSNLVGTLTKSTKSSSSRRTLSAYRQGKLSIIVATDRASRGLDLLSLSHVVSYDVPASVTSYIHRVGRTARAGREGSAWTLVAHREGRWFSKEVVKGPIQRVVGDRVVKKVHLQLDDDTELRKRYADALGQLERQIADSARPASRVDKQPHVPPQ